jgi:hypothetical protein
MAAINIELLDALKKAGVDKQKRGQSFYDTRRAFSKA